jgi:hypothetical protein
MKRTAHPFGKELDMPSPTVRSTVRGYDYDETSPDWKTMCLALPCFKEVRWPDYDTAIVEGTIDGEPVVIQLWKGLVPGICRSLGLPRVGSVRRLESIAEFQGESCRRICRSFPFLYGYC